MSFIEKIKEKAKEDIKTIVLPEGTDERVLKGGIKAIEEGYAKVIFVGNEEEILKIAIKNNIEVSNLQIVDPEKSDKTLEYANILFQIRKEKGMTEAQAKTLVLDPVYFGMMMLKEGEVDGLVSGAVHSTSDTLRPALQIIKTSPGTKLVSAFFVMVTNSEYGENGVLVFGDCGLNENPDSEGLSEIAKSSSESFEMFTGKKAKVAMLSYSTYGSAKSQLTDKVIEATRLVREKYPKLDVDGELQLDAAIVESVGSKKAPGSCVAGKANVLIFPDLNSGNIGYKLVQRFGNAEAYGPLCQGIAKPVNDLSRGCSSDDVAGVIAFTAIQAQKLK
ncbi:MAG: phosphate acetyltransferase [Clostridia bacterium]|nr:phosphate acetyltransferase [Clostridia bacterium]